jgi:hypothetical protein
MNYVKRETEETIQEHEVIWGVYHKCPSTKACGVANRKKRGNYNGKDFIVDGSRQYSTYPPYCSRSFANLAAEKFLSNVLYVVFCTDSLLILSGLIAGAGSPEAAAADW